MTSALLLVIVPSASVIAVPVGSFGNVTDVGDAVNDPPDLAGAQFEPSISPDGLKLYYTQGHPELGSGWRIYQASRPTTSDTFDDIEMLGRQFNLTGSGGASTSADDLAFYFGAFNKSAQFIYFIK